MTDDSDLLPLLNHRRDEFVKVFDLGESDLAGIEAAMTRAAGAAAPATSGTKSNDQPVQSTTAPPSPPGKKKT